jgi:hypothetical protein
MVEKYRGRENDFTAYGYRTQVLTVGDSRKDDIRSSHGRMGRTCINHFLAGQSISYESFLMKKSGLQKNGATAHG